MDLTADQIEELENETVLLCQEMIRIPSVNYGEGKGDEKAMAEYVAAKLSEVGISSELIETAPNRVNVVAKFEGRDPSRPGLVLHGHIDVVPANAEDWSVDPFSGVIKDGFIWGRGAVDMKDMDAMILATVRMWKRMDYLPPRNILLVFFADEEAAGEVGGFSVTVTGDNRLYLIEAAQKGIQWMKLTAKGAAGHGSFINRDNSVTKISNAVAKIGNYEWPQLETKTNAKFFKKLAEVTEQEYDPKDVSPLLVHLGNATKMIGATISNTANPTMLEAGYKVNVIPQEASAFIDGRFLPGYENQLSKTIKDLVGEDIEIELLARDIALEVDFAGPLVDAMCSAIQSEDSTGIPVPYLMSGGTDNKALHDLGIIGYGFSPLKLPKDLDFFSLFHGVDERVPIDGLKFGVRVLANFLDNI